MPCRTRFTLRPDTPVSFLCRFWTRNFDKSNMEIVSAWFFVLISISYGLVFPLSISYKLVFWFIDIVPTWFFDLRFGVLYRYRLCRHGRSCGRTASDCPLTCWISHWKNRCMEMSNSDVSYQYTSVVFSAVLFLSVTDHFNPPAPAGVLARGYTIHTGRASLDRGAFSAATFPGKWSQLLQKYWVVGWVGWSYFFHPAITGDHSNRIGPMAHRNLYISLFLLLRGTIVNRTYGIHENLYV